MALLSAADYPAIRAAIDVSLTARVLPDSVIGLPIYVDAAEAEVLARDPLAESRTGAALQHVTNAALLLVASFLAAAMPGYTAEDFSDYSYQRKDDWAARAAELRQRAEAELAAVLAASAPTTYNRPTMFTVASGRRGQ